MSTQGEAVGQTSGSQSNQGFELGAGAAAEAAVERPRPLLEADEEHRNKRARTAEGSADVSPTEKKPRVTGIAPIKEEYLIKDSGVSDDRRGDFIDDDEAEGRGQNEGGSGGGGGGRKGKRGKNKGQNKERDFGWSRDALRLCASVANSDEFSPKQCRSGERCRCVHSVREYLSEGRRGDVETFGGKCPVFELYGRCPSGWRCRFVSSHMKEIEHEDGRKELVLVENARGGEAEDDDDARPGIVNVVPAEEKHNLMRKRTTLDKSEAFVKWLDRETSIIKKIFNDPTGKSGSIDGREKEEEDEEEKETKAVESAAEPTIEDYRAQFVDPPFLPSEKRRIYFGPETPTLAPLTTQGNLPFRRLCVELGCEATYSEMALGLDLLAGKPSEWALMKAHESEARPPRVDASSSGSSGYDNARDLRFGAQIAANQPWMAIKATEALARLVPHLRLVDMNCGCPIEMLFKTGGGSGLLEAHNKLERMVRGMNAVSGEVPITAKLRVGVRDGSPTAHKVIERLAFGGVETRGRLGAPGCAAITLHGRTRNQRYKKPADWAYIAECAALVRSYNQARDDLADTAAEPDPRTQAASRGRIYFLGNGDCYSHEQYRAQIEQAGVDSVMIGRGALVKPWIFEEIAAGQYLDKSASERLAYVEKFARYGMEAWGTDEQGLGTTRRFLLEYLSFTSRYVPVGLLEHLPPSLSDRPPAYRSRNELETLLASRNYKDWIKISEMFLGPAHPDFKFVPKHKSNSYEIEGEG